MDLCPVSLQLSERALDSSKHFDLEVVLWSSESFNCCSKQSFSPILSCLPNLGRESKPTSSEATSFFFLIMKPNLYSQHRMPSACHVHRSKITYITLTHTNISIYFALTFQNKASIHQSIHDRSHFLLRSVVWVAGFCWSLSHQSWGLFHCCCIFMYLHLENILDIHEQKC